MGMVGMMRTAPVSLREARRGVVFLLAAAVLVGLVWWLRGFRPTTHPELYISLDLVQDLMALTILANVLLRYKASRDSLSVALAAGLLLAALAETTSCVAFFSGLSPEGHAQVKLPAGWVVGHVLPALLLLAAWGVQGRLVVAKHPNRELVAAMLVAVAAAFLLGAGYAELPSEWAVRPGGPVARPWQLVPAVLFLVAALQWARRPGQMCSALEQAFRRAAWLNFAGHLFASQSASLLDAGFAMTQLLSLGGYAVVLGGALLDNARLYERVEHLAVSDPLTGLANYRRFIHTLHAELERAARTGRSFSIVLLDLDGLKKINDRYGHLVGSQALRRLADVLRMHCRAMDTAARFGGDEFALILPETNAAAAVQVVARVRDRLAHDGQPPPISASAGVAVYPEHGHTLDALIEAADRALYEMKRTGQLHLPVCDRKQHWTAPQAEQFPARLAPRSWPATARLSRMQIVFGDGAMSSAFGGDSLVAVANPELEGEGMPKTYAAVRSEERIPMSVAVRISGDPNLPGVETTFTENVSASGARVVTVRRWRPNEIIWISSLPGNFQARARVAYCQPLHGIGYAIGLEFLQPVGRWVVDPSWQAGQPQGA